MTLKLVGPDGDECRSYADPEEANGRPMTASEIADLVAQLAEQKRFAAAHVATTETTVTFSRVDGDPSTLATAEVDLAYPISMGVSGIKVRLWTPEERAMLGPGAPSVRLVFARPETPEDELLDRAITPKILRAWEQQEKERARARMRTIK